MRDLHFSKILTTIALFFWTAILVAQTHPALLITSDSDTIRGRARYNRLSNVEAPMEIQNIGLEFESQDKKKKFYSPSSLKEVHFFNSDLDTLRLVSYPRTIFEEHIDAIARDNINDTHVLIKTDRGKGPLHLHTVYTGTGVSRSTMNMGNGQYAGTSIKHLVFKKFISKETEWYYLPEDRKKRNKTLIKALSDCPSLVNLLERNKINSIKKMGKILSLYNNCKAGN